MTQNEFIAMCVERTLDPALVLEDETMIEVLRHGTDDDVVEYLDNAY
jgi:hypothetical protein